METKRDTGLDLHVYIRAEDKPMHWSSAFSCAGAGTLTPEQANQVLAPTMGQFQGMRKFTYPVCLLFFTLRDEQAYFSWLAEPVVPDEMPKLVHHQKAKCVPLTEDLLAQVVEQIVTWYDAVEAVLIA